jgi:hypothetical protein
MASIAGTFIRPAVEARDYAPVLRWLLLNAVLAFAMLVLWHFGLLQAMLDTDPTKVSLLILALFALTALHCLYQTVVVSRELIAARNVTSALSIAGSGPLVVHGETVRTADGTELEAGILTSHIRRLVLKSANQGGAPIDQTLLLRSLADRLRSKEKLGWFVSESLLRMALLGTAIGFIIMLIPLAQVSSFDPETLRTALSGMSEGMAVALNVTVAGIAAALALKFEYYLLDGAIADLFGMITEVTEVQVVPKLEAANGRV